MQRALFLLALALPFAPHAPKRVLQLEIVGPSVLMNREREGAIAIVDLRPRGARRDLGVPIGTATVFALGEPEAARVWAQKRGLTEVFVVPPRMIEFEAMRNVPQIAPRAAREKNSRQNWPLFDVSEAVEFAAQRLPGSRRLDFIDFQRGNLTQLPKNRPFIVACRVGHRSQLVTRRLREMGYDARNLTGGLWEWRVEGLPLEGAGS